MLRLGKFERVEKFYGICDRQKSQIVNIFSADGNAESFGTETLSAAGGAFAMRHVFFKARFHAVAPRFLIAAAHIGKNPDPRTIVRALPLAALLVVDPANIFIRISVPEEILLLFVQTFKRSFNIRAGSLKNRFEHTAVPRASGIIRSKRAFIKRKIFIRRNQHFVVFHFFAESRTFRARAERIVKAEQARLQFGNGNTAVRTGILLTEKNFFFAVFALLCNGDNAACAFKSRFYGVGKTLTHVRA